MSGWHKAVASVGLLGSHFHDLRHAGNTLAASSGVSTRELMHRTGHSTIRATLIYRHKSNKRDRLGEGPQDPPAIRLEGRDG